MKTKLNVGTMRNQCPACGELFNSVGAFDKHRYGEYGKEDKEKSGTYKPSDRKCLDRNGMEELGMLKNNAGFWISSKNDSFN